LCIIDFLFYDHPLANSLGHARARELNRLANLLRLNSGLRGGGGWRGGGRECGKCNTQQQSDSLQAGAVNNLAKLTGEFDGPHQYSTNGPKVVSDVRVRSQKAWESGTFRFQECANVVTQPNAGRNCHWALRESTVQ
jgi:hypothetical protein